MPHRNSDAWEQAFAKCEAFWRHSGNRDHPYVRLASGLISDGYFNGGKVAENNPKLYGEACEALWDHASFMPSDATRIIAPAMSGIALAQRLGEAAGLKSAHTVLIEDEHVFARQNFDAEELLIMADDTITSGVTLNKLAKAAMEASRLVEFAPFVLALCDRSDPDAHLRWRVICLIRPVFKTWVDGRNPYTADGQERVTPIKATKTNWSKLTLS
jgi:orotate phosphoribosyltransferase